MGCYAEQCYSYPQAWLEVSNFRHQVGENLALMAKHMNSL